MKIKFNLDDDLPLNKRRKPCNMSWLYKKSWLHKNAIL